MYIFKAIYEVLLVLISGKKLELKLEGLLSSKVLLVTTFGCNNCTRKSRKSSNLFVNFFSKL